MLRLTFGAMYSIMYVQAVCLAFNGGFNMLPDYYLLSLSGGKDSTAMLIEWLERHKTDPENYPLHEVMYCDTGIEFLQMQQHIDKLEKIVAKANVKFTRLKSDRSFEYMFFDYVPKHKDPKLRGIKGKSWPSSTIRWCTCELKRKVINQHLRELQKKYNVIQLVGLAADETYRLSRPNNKNRSHKHPLVEWEWTEEDCLKYCYSKGFDWGGLYEIFHRVSCWCCPLKSLDELRALRKHFPELWSKLLDMEHNTWRNFRSDYSVDQLEIRFKLEEERKLKGLSVSSHNLDFLKQLKIALNENKKEN